MSIADAAGQLNLSIDTVRRRVRTGAIKARRDNRGQWWLDLPEPVPEPRQPLAAERMTVGVATPLPSLGSDSELVALLREEVADLRARLDASEAERREDKGRWLTEHDRLRAIIDKDIRPKGK
jgi:hypothetical protein